MTPRPALVLLLTLALGCAKSGQSPSPTPTPTPPAPSPARTTEQAPAPGPAASAPTLQAFKGYAALDGNDSWVLVAPAGTEYLLADPHGLFAGDYAKHISVPGQPVYLEAEGSLEQETITLRSVKRVDYISAETQTVLFPTNKRALGNEPFWNIDLFANGSAWFFDLSTATFARYEVLKEEKRAGPPAASIYSIGSASDGTVVITLTFTHSACQDSMSGHAFAYQTRAEIPGRDPLTGCGEDTP